MPRLRSLLCTAIVPLALGLAACGSDDDAGSSSSSAAATTQAAPATAATTTAAADSCDKASLSLISGGKLTVGTDKPAYPPYFEDDDPTNGKGFESAVAYAIAKQLGFEQSDVKWKVVPFNSSYAPGTKKFDFDINQISISPQRAKRVDFSEPYYTTPQAVVALKGSKADGATSLAALGSVKLGVQVGTTSLDAVTSSIKPSSQPQVYNDSNDTVRALKTKRIDAIVVDLPTAFYITGAQVENAKIVGQFAAPGGDDWGVVMSKGSELKTCVDKAIATLTTSGELKTIQDKWLGGESAPELK